MQEEFQDQTMNVEASKSAGRILRKDYECGRVQEEFQIWTMNVEVYESAGRISRPNY